MPHDELELMDLAAPGESLQSPDSQSPSNFQTTRDLISSFETESAPCDKVVPNIAREEFKIYQEDFLALDENKNGVPHLSTL